MIELVNFNEIYSKDAVADAAPVASATTEAPAAEATETAE